MRTAGHGRAVSIFFGLVAILGCGGPSAPLSTPTKCPEGRTVLDGVCVSEQVADYVACVRAQGATLGGSKAQKISAEAGTFGVRAAGASEVSESLERTYSVSDQATLEVIRGCRERGAGTSAATAKAATASGSAGGKTYTFEDANYWSDTLAVFKGQTDPQECARLCDQRSDCKVASFCDATCPDGWGSTCTLRSKAADRRVQPPVKSWVKP